LNALPRFWSGALRAKFWLALTSDPRSALAGLYWFARRRRVRGWSQLLVAAAESPDAYRQWTISGEPQLFADFERRHAETAQAAVAVLLVVDEQCQTEQVAQSVRSLHAAFGADIAIFSTAAVAGCETVGRQGVTDVATSRGLDWLLPVLAGDMVSPRLGEIFPRAAAMAGDAALMFWDEDALSAGGARCDPWIKPGWDPLLFGQLPGLAGASAVRVGRLPTAASLLTGRDDLERLLLGIATEPGSGTPVHVPLVLTHRSDRTRLKPDHEPKTLPLPRACPKISILVPTRDQPELLAGCLRGIQETSYPGEIELILIDNGSVDPDALRLIASVHEQPAARVIRDDGPFNFSRLNNQAAAAATGEFLCFLNNDVEPVGPDWLTAMVHHASGQDVGAVGALLLYPDGTIQHAGVAVGVGGAAGHIQKGAHPDDDRFWTWHRVSREVTAVTAAAMVVRKSSFLEVGGFDEAAFPVAFNDVDLCLRLKRAGLRNIFAAEARLVHHESRSRGEDVSPEQVRRFRQELHALQDRWQTQSFVDRHYSPSFSRLVGRCVLTP